MTQIAQAIDAEDSKNVEIIRLPNGAEIGRRMMVDATEKNGLMNRARLSILDVGKAPGAEAARVEYEHDKQGKFGVKRVYSVQSVRMENGLLELYENFIAENPQTVREEDFRPIGSDAYARSVVKSVEDWTRYRAWQRQQAAPHKGK